MYFIPKEIIEFQSFNKARKRANKLFCFEKLSSKSANFICYTTQNRDGLYRFLSI
jgi:hypothetical protein